MSRISRDLEEFRDEAMSPAAKAEWQASARAVEAWERAHPVSPDAILSWIDQLREAFGDPPVDRTPWHGNRFLID